MKKLILFLLFYSNLIFSQVPQAISHRGTVYDSAGILKDDTDIQIKISVMDNSTSIYAETFILTTNHFGEYSLNIGSGTPVTGAFSAINWGNNTNKYLKVEIDINNNGSYGDSIDVKGQNQLLSVPYALYAKNTDTNTSVYAVNSICDLRNSTMFSASNIAVYVKGYRYAGDGGGGYFYWKTFPSPQTAPVDDDGIIIQPAPGTNPPSNPPGRWMRQIDGDINVRFYGSTGNSQPNDGARIQKAIDYTNSIGGGTVYIPEGNYKIYNSLYLKTNVTLRGDGVGATILTAGYPGEGDVTDMYGCDLNGNVLSGIIPKGITSYTGYMFGMTDGKVTVNISDMTLEGAGNSTSPDSTTDLRKKGGIYFGAVPKTIGGITEGGLWRSTFKNINIYNFNGTGIHLDGGGGTGYTYTTPNQFNIFENVHVLRKKSFSQCLQITGQTGQTTFLNCLFDGITYDGNPNAGSFKVIKGFNVSIGNEGDITGAVISFINSTFEISEYGVIVNFAENVTFDNCWFETLDNAITASNNLAPSKGITITNSRFANAGGFGSLNVNNLNTVGGVPQGRCITVTGSEMNVTNNYVCVSDLNVSSAFPLRNPFVKNFITASNSKGIRTSGNSFQDQRLSRTFGISNTLLTVTSNSIDALGHRYVLVNNSAQNIKEIKSSLLTAETLTVRANGGLIVFDNSKNIILTNQTFTLNIGETATFLKMDGIYTNLGMNFNESWQLIGINKVN